MKISYKHTSSWRGSQWLLSLVAILVGCGPTSQPAASGRVVLPSAGTFSFAGDSVELRSKDKPTQLAFGQIQPDGSFKVESLVDGKIVPGAPPGKYQARLVIADDDYAHKSQAAKAIPKKYFNFDTSTLLVDVPSQDIQLNISK